MPVLRAERADMAAARRYIEPRPAPSGLLALYCRIPR